MTTRARAAACLPAVSGLRRVATVRTCPYVEYRSGEGAAAAAGVPRAVGRAAGTGRPTRLGRAVARSVTIRIAPRFAPPYLGALPRGLFAMTDVYRFEASTDVDNTAEQRALEKVGFSREGVLREPSCAAVSAVTWCSTRCSGASSAERYAGWAAVQAWNGVVGSSGRRVVGLPLGGGQRALGRRLRVLVVQAGQAHVAVAVLVVLALLLAGGREEHLLGRRVVQRSQTHRARVGRDLDGAPSEVAASLRGQLPDNHDLRMGRRVAGLRHLVGRLGQDLAGPGVDHDAGERLPPWSTFSRAMETVRWSRDSSMAGTFWSAEQPRRTTPPRCSRSAARLESGPREVTTASRTWRLASSSRDDPIRDIGQGPRPSVGRGGATPGLVGAECAAGNRICNAMRASRPFVGHGGVTRGSAGAEGAADDPFLYLPACSGVRRDRPRGAGTWSGSAPTPSARCSPGAASCWSPSVLLSDVGG